jgi:hypothetical protein
MATSSSARVLEPLPGGSLEKLEALAFVGEDGGAGFQQRVVVGNAFVERVVDQFAQGRDVEPKVLEDARAHLAGEVFEQLEPPEVGIELSQIFLAFAEQLGGCSHRPAVGNACVEAVVEHLPDHDEVCLDLLSRVHGSTVIGPNRYVETAIS